MGRGFHVVISNYGFWLPNDPRGSWSDFVGKWELIRFGKATKIETRQSVAGANHNRNLRAMAKRRLAYPAVRLSGRQALAVGHGFARAQQEAGYLIYACAVLPEHSHLVIGETGRPINAVVGHLKGRATQSLVVEGMWPNAQQPMWGRGCWKVFLYSEDEMQRAIGYVEQNPQKEGKPRQTWSFLQPYVNI